MAHPLRGKLSIDVDDEIGIGNLASLELGGQHPGGAFFDPRDPRVTPQLLDTWRGFGRLAGVRFVPAAWYPGIAPESAAAMGSGFISALEQDGRRRVDVAEWDLETGDRVWELRFLLGSVTTDGRRLKGIRGCGGAFPDPTRPATLGYRWGRPGVWTMQGRQDAGTSAAAEAAQTGLLVGPQLYNGPMTELWDLWFEVLTWCLDANPLRPNGAKIPLANLIPYYDARRLPVGAVEAVVFSSSRAQ